MIVSIFTQCTFIFKTVLLRFSSNEMYGKLTYACEVTLKKILNQLMVYHFGMPRSWEVQKCENQNQGVPSAKVATKNSHQKPPKSPVGGISPSPLNETCWASNSVWKIGIISLIWITQSKVRAFQKLQKSPKMTDFQSVELWTA